MRQDLLGRLLVRADDAAGAPPLGPDDLAGRVREVARRRQARRRVAAGVFAVMVAMLGIVGGAVMRGRDGTRLATFVPASRAVVSMDEREVARVRREIDALRAEADARDLAVVAMLDGEARARREARGRVDPLEGIRAHQELGALALVRQAERWERELDRPAAAARTYARVVELFPNTPWAAVARQRLGNEKG